LRSRCSQCPLGVPQLGIACAHGPHATDLLCRVSDTNDDPRPERTDCASQWSAESSSCSGYCRRNGCRRINLGRRRCDRIGCDSSKVKHFLWSGKTAGCGISEASRPSGVIGLRRRALQRTPHRRSVTARSPSEQRSWRGMSAMCSTRRLGSSTLPSCPRSFHMTCPSFQGTLAFCAVDACVTTCWFTIVACLAQRFSGWLRRPRVLAVAERSTGVVLVGIGVRTAIERS
jgi:hypothetical protein